MTRVRQMTGRTGRPVANQFLITTPEGVYFQSYKTVIAFREDSGKTWLDRDHWDYSVTTGKYRNHFLGMNKAETQKAIEAGDIGLVNLNQ